MAFERPSRAAVLDRAEFLKLSGAGLAGVFLLGTFGAGEALARPAASLDAEFTEAARRYKVPKAMLSAMGYVNTHWEMPDPGKSAYREGDPEGRGAYGMMALTENPSQDTLGEAARLTGISKEKLKTDRFSNILGGAALLARASGTERPKTLRGYRGAVAGRGEAPGKNYHAAAGVGGGQLYAEQIYETLKRGASRKTKSGEFLKLDPREVS